MADKHGLLALLDELEEVVDDLREFFDDGAPKALAELTNIVDALRTELEDTEIYSSDEDRDHLDLKTVHPIR